ncbi:MAG: cytochrome-c peroxidase, partial [Bacteroidetes bacterium]|nr:cytochrome-c peroxidase [Bacteroidota bacterium]
MFLGGILLIVFFCGEREESLRSTRKKTTQTLSDLGALPLTVTHPAENPTSEKKIELGRLLFYDPVLSGNRDVACATCHQPEFNYAEFMETSIGVNGVGNGTKRRFVNPNDIPFV